jgi:hypothetical protein
MDPMGIGSCFKQQNDPQWDDGISQNTFFT